MTSRRFAEPTTGQVCQTAEQPRTTPGARAPTRRWTVAHVPAGAWAHCRHTGPLEKIGETFGAIEHWLREQGRTVGGMKLDLGYRADARPQVHELYVHVPGPDPM